MAGKKVMICPICGGKVIKLWIKDFTQPVYFCERACNDGREVIPLVTPQEEK